MRILRFLPPVLFGVALGGLIGWIVTGDWIYAIVFGVSLAPAFLVPLFLGLRNRGVVGADDGGYAAGRVESVQRVGAAADGRQQVDVRVSVFSRDDSPYQTTVRTTVDDAALRTVAAGSFIPLMRLGPRVRPDVSYAPTAPPEWMQHVEQLRSESSTLPPEAQVKPWETATTTTPGTPKPGSVRRRAGALGLVLVLVTAGLTLIPAYGAIGRAVNNIAQGRWDGSNMVTGLYQQPAVDQMVAAAGTTQFTNLGFYPDYVLGDAVSRSAPDRTDLVQWQYGRAWVEGPSYSQTAALQEELFDVGELDMSVVADVARDGVERAGIQELEYVFAFVRMDSSIGEPVITVSMSGPYDDAYLDYGFDGELIEAYGTAFE